jgi:hypothetical protein
MAPLRWKTFNTNLNMPNIYSFAVPALFRQRRRIVPFIRELYVPHRPRPGWEGALRLFLTPLNTGVAFPAHQLRALTCYAPISGQILHLLLLRQGKLRKLAFVLNPEPKTAPIAAIDLIVEDEKALETLSQVEELGIHILGYSELWF